MNKAVLRKLLSLSKKRKQTTENIGTDQNSKLLSDLTHVQRSDMAEPEFDHVQILEDN